MLLPPCRLYRTLVGILSFSVLITDEIVLALPFSEHAIAINHAAAAGRKQSLVADNDGTTHNSTTNHNITSKKRRPVRGAALPENPTAQDAYDAYAAIEKEYQLQAFSSTAMWKLLTFKHGVKVSLLHHPDDPTCPYVKMEGRIPVPVQDCWNFLNVSEWNRTMPLMDPFYEGVTTHGEFTYEQSSGVVEQQLHHSNTTSTTTTTTTDGKQTTTHMILCRKRMKRLLAFGKRDLVFLSVYEGQRLEDGSWVSGTVSVRTPDLPRCTGYTRAFQDSIAFYKPVCNGTETDLTIVCRIDLNDSSEHGSGGCVPMWLYVKTVGTTAAASVHKMRRALVAEHQQRSKQLGGIASKTSATADEPA